MTLGWHRVLRRARASVLVGCVAAFVAVGFAADAKPSRADQPGSCSASQLASRQKPIIYRPAWLSPAQPVPLLIALHGSGGNPAGMNGLTHFEIVANEHGFVVAFPASCDLANPWSASQDLPYVSSMIAQLSASQNIDPARVYVTGFSAGGYETWRTACRLSRQVAAIAVVSDAMSQATVRVCSLAHPISQLLIVGTANGYIFAGIPGRLPSALQTTAWWRSADGCALSPTRIQRVSTVIEQTWTSCTDGTDVALYEVQGGVHVWPPYGAGAPTNYPTSEAVWAFLSAHRAAPFSLSTTDVALQSAHATRKGRKRTILATFRATEPVIIKQVLGPHHLRSLRATWLPGSRIRVSINVASPSVRTYTLVLAVRDPYGRQRVFSRTVLLPALKPRA